MRLIPTTTAVAAATLLAATPTPAGLGPEVAEAAGGKRGATQIAKERAMRRCVNAQRARYGLAPLAYAPGLARAARLHAFNMARLRFFGHTDLLGRSPGRRVAKYSRSYSGVGENIAAGQRTARGVCAAWMRSPGHRANILSPRYRYLGTGYVASGPYRRYYVQDFAARKRT